MRQRFRHPVDGGRVLCGENPRIPGEFHVKTRIVERGNLPRREASNRETEVIKLGSDAPNADRVLTFQRRHVRGIAAHHVQIIAVAVETEVTGSAPERGGIGFLPEDPGRAAVIGPAVSPVINHADGAAAASLIDAAIPNASMGDEIVSSGKERLRKNLTDALNYPSLRDFGRVEPAVSDEMEMRTRTPCQSPIVLAVRMKDPQAAEDPRAAKNIDSSFAELREPVQSGAFFRSPRRRRRHNDMMPPETGIQLIHNR